ncbi:MAG: alpha/beta hydrolase [Gammaproteobacteria bacterium]|nr:alpha/beta hydrolase [Gammaproteobacteria bacterium]
MKIYFSHGKESGPWGFKIKRLAEIATQQGCEVESVDYTDLPDPDQRAERLFDTVQNEPGDFILVGSSMGGYVSLACSEKVTPKAVFLMAPALYMPGFKLQQHHSKCNDVEIVHAWSDEVIPAAHSIKHARQADCTLHLISGDHALNTSIMAVESLFERFLCRVLGR